MHYLVSVIDDGAGPATPAEDAAIDVFNDRLAAAGHWVFAGGLAMPDTATTIDNRGGAALFTDGPFVETKEQVGGFYVIDCKDLDEALDLAAKMPHAEGGTTEIRPVMEYADPRLAELHGQAQGAAS